MKKLLSMLLALALVFSMSSAVFAVRGENETEVTYKVDPTYTVTIPESVTLGGTGTVEIKDASVAKGEKVVVKIDSTSGTDNAFTVQSAEGAVVTYTITDGTKTFAVKDTVLEAAPSDTAKGNGSIVLTFTTPTNVIYAGTYTGTVTFAVSVEAV